MRSLKKTKGLTLFTLSLPTTVFGERHHDGYVPYNFLYQRLLLKRASIRYALAQLTQTGEVNKIKRNFSRNGAVQPLVALSTLGRKRLRDLLPALLPVGRSKFGFFLVIFSQIDSTKTQRQDIRKLRLTLQDLGFVQITRGVYGGWQDLADQVEERVIELQLSQEVLLIPFEQASFFKPKELSYKVLQLKDQSQTCLGLINSFQRLLRDSDKRKELSVKQKRSIKLGFREAFFLLKRLPALPTSLAPADWPVEELKEQLKLASKAISA